MMRRDLAVRERLAASLVLGWALAVAGCGPTAATPPEATGDGFGDDGKFDGPACAGSVCYDRCSFATWPSTGCREGDHCERRVVGGVTAEVCVAGAWATGLVLSADGESVLGLDPVSPTTAEPHRTLATTRCGDTFAPVASRLFAGLAHTLLALGSQGRGLRWERLCDRPSDLPDRHGVVAEAQAGRGFRLIGARTAVIGWVGYALYGQKTAAEAWRRGPLWSSRVMVYANDGSGRYYLYADGADDFPGPDPTAGRHFAEVNRMPWRPLDSELLPDVEFRLFKANQPPSFTRQWADERTIAYLGALARGHLERHGWPLGIGDASFPTGGDIDDHSSHKTGRDTDVYLVSYPTEDVTAPRLWLSQCTRSGATWSCWYTDYVTGAREGDLGPHSAAAKLGGLAEHALLNPGLSHFVHHDVVVVAPVRARSTGVPRFLDASNAASSGWPPHQDHVHLRFAW